MNYERGLMLLNLYKISLVADKNKEPFFETLDISEL